MLPVEVFLARFPLSHTATQAAERSVRGRPCARLDSGAPIGRSRSCPAQLAVRPDATVDANSRSESRAERENPINKQVEVLLQIGDIPLNGAGPRLHAHLVGRSR